MESLDAHVIARIIGYLDGPWDVAALRATCATLRAIIPCVAHMEPHVLLRLGARMGRRDLCEYAHSRGTWNYSGMVREAARAGSVDLCKLAHNWAMHDVTDAFDCKERVDVRRFHEYFRGRQLLGGEYFELRETIGIGYRDFSRNAARCGSDEMFKLALDGRDKFGIATRSRDAHLFNARQCAMIRGAAECGEKSNINRVFRLGSDDFEGHGFALAGAARGGHIELCRKIIDTYQYIDTRWNRASVLQECFDKCRIIRCTHYNVPHHKEKAFNLALYEAARANHLDICDLLIEHGANDICYMLGGAARGGHRALCEIALERGAQNYNNILTAAARGGHRALCEFAIEHGAFDYDGMLLAATRGNHHEICELARKFGARAFYEMARIAHDRAHVGLCKLSCEWRAGQSPAPIVDDLDHDIARYTNCPVLRFCA